MGRGRCSVRWRGVCVWRVRVAPSMNAQDVANTVWAHATLGWQGGEGVVRRALEGAAVRFAPSMNTQDTLPTVTSVQADSRIRIVMPSVTVGLLNQPVPGSQLRRR